MRILNGVAIGLLCIWLSACSAGKAAPQPPAGQSADSNESCNKQDVPQGVGQGTGTDQMRRSVQKIKEKESASTSADSNPQPTPEDLLNTSILQPQQLQMTSQLQELGWQFHSPIFEGPPVNEFRLKSTTTLGGTITSGNNDSTTLSGSQDFVLTYGKSRNELIIGGIYGRDSVEGQRISSTQLLFVRPQTEYHLTQRLYVYGGSGYEQYREAGIKHQFILESGLGYFFYESRSMIVKGELGYRFDRELRIDPYPSENVNAVSNGVEFTVLLGNALFLDIDLMSLYDVENDKNYRLYANSTLTAQINKHFSVGMTLGVRYDNEPVIAFERADTYQTFDVSLTY